MKMLWEALIGKQRTKSVRELNINAFFPCQLLLATYHFRQVCLHSGIRAYNAALRPKIGHFLCHFWDTTNDTKCVKRCPYHSSTPPEFVDTTWKTDVTLISLHCPSWHTVYQLSAVFTCDQCDQCHLIRLGFSNTKESRSYTRSHQITFKGCQLGKRSHKTPKIITE